MPCRPLSNIEIGKLLSVIDSKRDRALISLGLRTGYRISELLSLCIKDVIEGSGIKGAITVARRNMKGKDRSRSIVLHTQAKVELMAYLKSIDYLVLPLDTKLFDMSRFAAHRMIKTAVKKAGLSGRISTHSMRKTFGMKVYELTGRNIVAAQKALGHKSLASTSHYLSVDQEIVDNAILAE